ncbi:MAG: hypothetical protein JNK85_22535 [Verrucomicrobiales bacterium]|nr:hypothetical protein [Verrucomicrobiales bacterium]
MSDLSHSSQCEGLAPGVDPCYSQGQTRAGEYRIPALAVIDDRHDDASGAYLAGQLPEKTVDAKSDKVFLASVDANGRVTVTGGVPDLEIASVVTRSAVSGTTHNYTVLRGRKSTRARAWATSDQAWLIPSHNLTAWSHPDIGTLIQSGAVGHVRLLAMSAGTEAADAYERTFVMPTSYQVLPVITWTSPASNLGLTDGAGDIALALSVADADANLVSLRVDSTRADGTDPGNHASLSFAPSGARAWSGTVNLAFRRPWLSGTSSAGDPFAVRRTSRKHWSSPGS